MREFYYLTVPCVGALAVMVFHILLSQRRSGGFLEALVVAVALGFCAMLGLQVLVGFVWPLSGFDAAGYFIANLILFGALLYLYVNFVNMGETARRIRILTELRQAPQGLSRQELLKRYNAEEIIDKRLHRLCVTGQVIGGSDGLLRVKPGSAMLRVARFVRMMKILLLGKKG